VNEGIFFYIFNITLSPELELKSKEKPGTIAFPQKKKKEENIYTPNQVFNKFKPVWFEERLQDRATKPGSLGIKVEGKAISLPEKKKFTIKDLV
jgi:hypothetical protein